MIRKESAYPWLVIVLSSRVSNGEIPSYIAHSKMLFRNPLPINGLDKINRDFIWGSTPDKKKLHVAGLDKVAKPKYLGGLGIRLAGFANEIALAKLNWRVDRENDSLWAKVLKNNYGEFSSTRHRPSFVWRSLRKGLILIYLGRVFGFPLEGV